MYEVAIIGIDGAGKTTVGALLSDRLKAKGHRVELAHFKARDAALFGDIDRHGIEIPQEVRMIGYSLDLMAQHRHAEIASEDVVVWDRHICCLYAYFRALGLSTDWLDQVGTLIPQPDLTVWLRIEPLDAVERLDNSGRVRKPLENEDFLSVVHKQYSELRSRFSMIEINAARPLEKVVDEIEACCRIDGGNVHDSIYL